MLGALDQEYRLHSSLNDVQLYYRFLSAGFLHSVLATKTYPLGSYRILGQDSNPDRANSAVVYLMQCLCTGFLGLQITPPLVCKEPH